MTAVFWARLHGVVGSYCVSRVLFSICGLFIYFQNVAGTSWCLYWLVACHKSILFRVKLESVGGRVVYKISERLRLRTSQTVTVFSSLQFIIYFT